MVTSGADIVVPLDGSTNAENAVSAAAALQALYGGAVRFVHVADYELPSAEALDQARKTFADYADERANRLGVGARTTELLHNRAGSPAHAILDSARDARFIVIATHGRGGFKATVIGSVADKIVRGSSVPVLVIPGVGTPAPAFATRSIMVALDGSDAAETGLELARDIARRAEAAVVLARAIRLTVPVGFEYAYYPDDPLVAYEVEAAAYLESVARDGERQIMLRGVPAQAIVEAAQQLESDIVVMATQGKGLAGRIALGSTTERVMHSLHQPLLVVPVQD